MRINRLFGILTILLRTDKVTAPYLAEKFEVSRRTINRDITDLCAAGIPIITQQGYGGGIYLAQGYKLKNTFLTIIDKNQKYRLVEEYGLDHFTEHEDGLHFAMGFTNTENLLRWVLSFGNNIKVIKPQWLIDKITNISKDVLQKY